MKIAGCTSFTHAAILSRFCPNSVDRRSVPYQVSGVCQVPDHLCSFFNRLLSYCRSHQVKMNFTIEIRSNSRGILRVGDGDGDDISLTTNMDGSTRRANLVTRLPSAACASTATSAVSSVYNTSVSTSSGHTSTSRILLAQLAQIRGISSPRTSSASASSARTSSARASSSRTSSVSTSSANPSSASTTSVRASSARTSSASAASTRAPSARTSSVRTTSVRTSSASASSTRAPSARTSSVRTLPVGTSSHRAGSSMASSPRTLKIVHEKDDVKKMCTKRISGEYTFGRLFCPVCFTDILKPEAKAEVTRCGHIFCYDCIEQVIRRDRKCPTCREYIGAGFHHAVYFPLVEDS
nr:PREDICTED: polycomb group protein Psc-like [Bemisia tabaci]